MQTLELQIILKLESVIVYRLKQLKYITSLLSLIALTCFINSCKKSEERTCFKSNGNLSSLVIPLDSVYHFNLYKNLRYEIFQDTGRYIKVTGGENLIQLVEVKNDNGILSVNNSNKCNFFRSNDVPVTVEIHYPYYKEFYFEPSDSVIFHDQITSDTLIVEIREGGGSATMDVDVNYLSVNVSYGTGDYLLKGSANNAEVKVQNNGFADASQFNSPYIFVYNNSTGDLKINLENSDAYVVLEGTGDIHYSGNPASLVFNNPGSGSLIKL